RRLRIEYADEQPNLPKTLVLKLSDTSKLPGLSQRDSAVERAILCSGGMSDANMLLRETLFYQKFHKLVSEPCALEIPDIYFAATSGRSTPFTRALFVLFKRKERLRGAILMEDLSSGSNLDAVGPCAPDVLSILCVEVGRLYGYTAKAIAEGDPKM